MNSIAPDFSNLPLAFFVQPTFSRFLSNPFFFEIQNFKKRFLKTLLNILYNLNLTKISIFKKQTCIKNCGLNHPQNISFFIFFLPFLAIS